MSSVVSSYFGYRKVNEAGMASRCEFHGGYLDSLPQTEPFNAATSILVSQFLTDPNQRRDFFLQIAMRLRPGGSLINADLVSCPINNVAFAADQLAVFQGATTPATLRVAMRAGRSAHI